MPWRDAEGQNREAPARIHCTLDAAFLQVRPGEPVWFDDGRIGGVVEANDGELIGVRITHAGAEGSRLRAEKGINFPETQFELSALTDKDIADWNRWSASATSWHCPSCAAPPTWPCLEINAPAGPGTSGSC